MTVGAPVCFWHISQEQVWELLGLLAVKRIFEQMSAITRADAGKIIPRVATYPFTDKTGVTYFQIRPHTWMHQDDVEQLSQAKLSLY